MTREQRTFTVFGFSTTHDALTAEDALRDASVEAVAIPTPAVLGSLCGIALRMLPDDEARARVVLESAGVRVTASAPLRDV